MPSGGSSSSRFSTAEIVFFLLVSIALDAYEIFATVTSIAVIGILLHIIGIFIDILWTGTINMVFYQKGGRWALNLIGDLIELIPVVDFLPIRTVVFIIAVILTNRSQKEAE